MTRTLLTRLARVEARFPSTTSHFDLSGLTEDELEMLAGLPRDEATLRDLIEDPAYDWSPLSRILERLEPLRGREDDADDQRAVQVPRRHEQGADKPGG